MNLKTKDEKRRQAYEYGKNQEELAWYFYCEANESSQPKLISKNYTKKCGEIDLIVEEQTLAGECVLVFIEVKTRKQKTTVSALDSITPSKVRKLVQTTEIFLQQYKGQAKSLRFDVVTYERGVWIHRKNAIVF